MSEHLFVRRELSYFGGALLVTTSVSFKKISGPRHVGDVSTYVGSTSSTLSQLPTWMWSSPPGTGPDGAAPGSELRQFSTND